MFFEGLDGTERLLLPTPKDANRTSNIAWSPDGGQLPYGPSGHVARRVGADTGAPTSALLNGPAAEHSAAFSPDGHWLAIVE